MCSEVRGHKSKVAIFLLMSIGRKILQRKTSVFVEVGITCLPQTLTLGKVGGCCSSMHLNWINKVLFLLPGMVLGWWLCVLLVSEGLSWIFFLWFAKYGPHAKLCYELSSLLTKKISVEFRAINLVVVAEWVLWLFLS